MKVAAYARVSTSNNGQDPEVQLRELREYVARRGWKLAGEYVDVGISGTEEKRPQLDRLRARGASWRTISRDMGIGLGTLYRAAS